MRVLTDFSPEPDQEDFAPDAMAHAAPGGAARHVGQALGRADADLAHVLGVLARLSPKPLENCLPAEARRQPLFDAAVKAILARTGREPDGGGIETEDITIDGAAGPVAARIYRPSAALRASYLPLVLYIHGGGWVLGDLDTYDASPRAIARKTGAVVVSVHYRQAPEHRFPAAHDDVLAAWGWMLAHARALGGAAHRIAVVGEGVGANMALNIGFAARSGGLQRPLHQVLITPWAGNDMTRPSFVDNMRGSPLGTPLVQWFVRHAFADRAETADPRINLVGRQDFFGLPSTTLILAELDPLVSDGQALGQALAARGVAVDMVTYDGVGHDFFGMGALVNKAMFAQSHVAANLGRVFSSRPIVPSAAVLGAA